MDIELSQVPSPCFVLEERLLKQNLQLLREVKEKAGVEIILALKGFAMWSTFPLVRQYLPGATASSLHEAKLINEEMGTKAHLYAPAYLDEEFPELMRLSSHITFNSVAQYERFKDRIAAFPEKISCGLRINPEYSEVEVEMYNPCAVGSRLGMTATELGETLPEGIEGLHFHNLCESGSYALENTLKSVEAKFAPLLKKVKWVNMGGGHLITSKGYNVGHLVQILRDFKSRYDVHVILEPGAAIAWQTGVLVSTVLDVVESGGIRTAILDVSFAAHMPDTLEMPYKPKILSATDPVPGNPAYRLGGLTCLAGDFMGDYSFAAPLQPGDKLVFLDMIHYTMVKTTTFNGVNLPSIGIQKEDNTFQLIKKFGYEEYKSRLS